jgi:hypothetical protein
MIDHKNLKFGDTVYVVDEKNNAYFKKKLKTVIDGVEWFRYDRDHWEYNVSEIVYCGFVKIETVGEVDQDRDRQDQMHFKYPCGNIYYEYVNDVNDIKEWFHTKTEADAYAEEMRKLKNND